MRDIYVVDILERSSKSQGDGCGSLLYVVVTCCERNALLTFWHILDEKASHPAGAPYVRAILGISGKVVLRR